MQKLNIEIRSATIKDLDRLVDLECQMAAYHHRLDSIWARWNKRNPLVKKIITEAIKKKRDEMFLVLLCNNHIVGYATAYIEKKGSVYSIKKMGHVGSVYVEKNYRKLGLGKLAIEKLLHWFRKNHITEVTLQVDANNNIGVSAWKKIGFKDWRLVLRKSL